MSRKVKSTVQKDTYNSEEALVISGIKFKAWYLCTHNTFKNKINKFTTFFLYYHEPRGHIKYRGIKPKIHRLSKIVNGSIHMLTFLIIDHKR